MIKIRQNDKNIANTICADRKFTKTRQSDQNITKTTSEDSTIPKNRPNDGKKAKTTSSERVQKLRARRKYDITFDDEKHKMKECYRGQENRKMAKIKREKDVSLLYEYRRKEKMRKREQRAKNKDKIIEKGYKIANKKKGKAKRHKIIKNKNQKKLKN